MESRIQGWIHCLVLVSCSVFVTGQISSSRDVVPGSASEMQVSGTESVSMNWTTDFYETNQNLTPSLYPMATDEATDSERPSGQNVTQSPMWLWQPVTWSWWMILQIIAALLGIVGNLLVIIILFQRRTKSRATDTLVGALAVADLLASIFMIPLPSAVSVPPTVLGEVYCRIVYTSVLMWVSVESSIMTLTCIPIEQYVAVVYPFRSKEILSRKRVLVVVVLIWLASLVIHVAFSFISGAGADPSQMKCALAFPSRKMQIASGVIHFVIQFPLPTCITLALQIQTARWLHRQSRLHFGADKRLDRSNPSTLHLIAKKRVLKTVFIVVLIYIICWGPNLVMFLAFNLRLLPPSYLYSPLSRSLTVLAFCNSCANPIVYTMRYPEFRKALGELFSAANRSDAPLFGDRSDTRASSKEGIIIP